jgi:hypothetical protein
MRLKLSVVLLCAFLVGCARYSLDYIGNYEPGQDYTRYKTFNFYDTSGRGEVAVNKELDQRLRQAVEAALIEAGYTQAASPDFYVNYYLDVTGSKNLDPYHRDPQQLPGNEKYRSGALVLDFIDASTNSRYWRGAALGDIAERTPKDRLEKAIDKILENYPPQD